MPLTAPQIIKTLDGILSRSSRLYLSADEVESLCIVTNFCRRQQGKLGRYAVLDEAISDVIAATDAINAKLTPEDDRLKLLTVVRHWSTVHDVVAVDDADASRVVTDDIIAGDLTVGDFDDDEDDEIKFIRYATPEEEKSYQPREEV